MISIINIVKKPIILFSLLMIIVGSCSNPKSKMAAYGPVFENVMRTESGVFRGFSLGDKMDSVKLRETGKPMESDENYLYYEMKMDSANSFNITYNFDDGGLNEIQSDIYIRNASKADEALAMFKKYFEEHYGKSETRQGYNVWTVKSEKYGEVRITLNNESSDFTVDNAPGKISIWIYPDKE